MVLSQKSQIVKVKACVEILIILIISSVASTGVFVTNSGNRI